MLPGSSLQSSGQNVPPADRRALQATPYDQQQLCAWPWSRSSGVPEPFHALTAAPIDPPLGDAPCRDESDYALPHKEDIKLPHFGDDMSEDLV
jgi:hypothetical protein